MDHDQRPMPQGVPQLYMGRFLSPEVARRVMAGELVPVDISADGPAVPLAYPLEESAPSLRPSPMAAAEMFLSQWPMNFSNLLDRLDHLGVAAVVGELAAISERYDDLPLVLLDHDNLLKGLKSPRVVIAYWLEEQTGIRVPEIADDGSEIPISHLQAHSGVGFTHRPQPPQPRTADRRYATNEHVAPWPLSAEDVQKWVESRFWQQAMSPRNPHAYTTLKWGSQAMFRRVVLHIREFGYEHTFDGAHYVQYDLPDGSGFLWSMGSPLEATSVINRKSHDGTGEACNWTPGKAHRALAAVRSLAEGQTLLLPDGGPSLQRIDAEEYRWTTAHKSKVLDERAAAKRLAGRKVDELQNLSREDSPRQPELIEGKDRA